MYYLLSLPPHLVDSFYELEGHSPQNWFVTADPEEKPLGAGGGTAHLLHQCWQHQESTQDFEHWLRQDKRILIHGGGKSRRLPAYAPVGKMLAPIPVFRWEKGQDIDQKLLDIQLPFYEKILSRAPARLNTLIASGDVLILDETPFNDLPEVDILVFGTWAEAGQASQHGVFFSPRSAPDKLAFMLQKPSPEKIQQLVTDYFFLMDTGIWLLSDKAVELLMQECSWSKDKGKFNTADNLPAFYDLYGQFSNYLGMEGEKQTAVSSKLSSALMPLNAGTFYHFGTSRELINSSYRIQNKVVDQREIWHKRIKPHPDIFVMNAAHKGTLHHRHHNLWIENAYIPECWTFTNGHIFTGIPENSWQLDFPEGICLNMVPVGAEAFCVQPYGIDDRFRGNCGDEFALWMHIPLQQWLHQRNISFEEAGFDQNTDIHQAPLFPVVKPGKDKEGLIRWMLDATSGPDFREKYLQTERLSSAALQRRVNLERLYQQRKHFRNKALPAMAKNYHQSVFYQLDLERLSDIYAGFSLPLPSQIDGGTSRIEKIHNRMLLARINQKQDKPWQSLEKDAFRLLKEAMLENFEDGQVRPQRNVQQDQIVWGRSPVRIDLAGGWSDTPPYCIINGGSVMNMAIELNGQPPVQVYITPSEELRIRIKSIDLGEEYRIESYEDLEDYHCIGAGFTIAKAALLLSGFHPGFGALHASLKEQLQDFGGGFDISLLAAVPKGSGLGTSSILASTLLGALSEYCGLNSDFVTLGNKTLILEQLLTTGGGWQDQYGGILPGVKLIDTGTGFDQTPEIRWLPEHLFRNEEYRASMLLYYTGVTRVAKNILAEIVRHMFLNHNETLRYLNEIKANAAGISEAVRKNSWHDFNNSINRSWQLNQLLDKGTNPEPIQRILSPVEQYLASCKLAGAGGGGYLLLIAKDPEAAARIQSYLRQNPPNEKARFVDFSLSDQGLTITKS